METQTSSDQLGNLCTQIRAINKPDGTHNSSDFDSIVSQTRRLADFHKIIYKFSKKYPESANILNKRINFSLTRYETVLQFGFKSEDIANAEKELLSFILQSLKKTIKTDTNESKAYVLHDEIIPIQRNNVIKPKISRSNGTTISAKERAENIKSLYLELEEKKGAEYALNILSPKAISVIHDLLFKNIPLTRQNIYPITDCTRSQLSQILRNLEVRLKEELDKEQH